MQRGIDGKRTCRAGAPCSRLAAGGTAVTSVVLVGMGGRTIVRSVIGMRTQNVLARFWRRNEQILQERAHETE